jgi:hypothetical protein
MTILIAHVHIVSIAAGPLILSEVGDVYSFGDGSAGQLGLGPSSVMTTPHIIDTLPGGKIYMVAGGYAHAVAVTGELPSPATFKQQHTHSLFFIVVVVSMLLCGTSRNGRCIHMGQQCIWTTRFQKYFS